MKVVKTTISLLLVCTCFYAILPATVLAVTEHPDITFLLTANLNGRFLTATKDQDRQDPMLIMAQSLIAEQKKDP